MEVMAQKVTRKQAWNSRFFRVGRGLPFLEYTQMIHSMTAETHSDEMFQTIFLHSLSVPAASLKDTKKTARSAVFIEIIPHKEEEANR